MRGAKSRARHSGPGLAGRAHALGVVYRFLVRALRLSSARLSCRRRGCLGRDLGKFAALAARQLATVDYSTLRARVQVFPTVDYRLRPGVVAYTTGLPPGPARNVFLTLMSLLPGSLPAWQGAGGKITVHCLDIGQPVAAQMAEEEIRLVRALGISPNDD